MYFQGQTLVLASNTVMNTNVAEELVAGETMANEPIIQEDKANEG